MTKSVDPVFEESLRESMAQISNLIRMAGAIGRIGERERIRKIIADHEDDDSRIPGILIDQILEEIGEEYE